MNVNALKTEIVRNGYTQQTTAEKIGVSRTTFYRKMKNGNFGIDEAKRLIDLLNIQDPAHIFFDTAPLIAKMEQ